MALSKITFSGDGVTDTFNVVFALGYIEESDVRAYVVGEVDGLGDQVYRPITFVTENLIQIGGDIPSTSGKDIVFERTVEKEHLLVDYENRDIMSEENLNASQKQMLMAIHEALDGRLGEQAEDRDMGGFRVTNLGTPVDNTDAVTKQYVDQTIPANVQEAQTARDQAVAARNAAVSARDAAQGSASTAGTAATNAGNSAIAANARAEDAEDAALAAAQSAGNAGDAENTAVQAASDAVDARDAAAGSASTASTAATTAVTSRNEAQDFAADAEDAAEDAGIALNGAVAARDMVYDWANKPEDQVVQNGEYSAYHWAKKAEASGGGSGGREVFVGDFGAVGDGITDDTVAVQAALLSVGEDNDDKGGTVTLGDGTYLITDDLIIPKGVSLVADNKFAGTFNEDINEETQQTITLKGGKLIMRYTATIGLSAGASLRGLVIMREGLTIPTTSLVDFQGTAVTIWGDDAMINGCLILGFNKAIVSSGNQRPKVIDVGIDCINGIDVSYCLDVPNFVRVHCWPYCTVDGFGGTPLIRTGIAFHIHGTVDSAKFEQCFSFGYFRGLEIDDCNAATIVNCGFDQYYSGGPAHPNSIGVRVLGTSTGTKLIGCMIVANNQAGVEVTFDTGTDQEIQIIGCHFQGGTTHGVLINGPGHVGVFACSFRDVAHGMTVSNANARLSSDCNSFINMTTSAHNMFTPTHSNKINIGESNTYSNVPTPLNGTLNIGELVTQANGTIVLPPQGNFFYVSGPNNVGTVHGVYAGRVVCLMASGSFQWLNSANLNLAGKTNWNPTAGSILVLLGTGPDTQRAVEIGRNVQ